MSVPAISPPQSPSAQRSVLHPPPTRRGLRRRVVVAFGIFALVLSTSFGVAVWMALHFSEDRLIQRLLELEMVDYLERRALDPEAPLPSTHWLGASWQAKDLPKDLQTYVDYPDGFHEINLMAENLQGGLAREYCISIRTLEGKRLYFYIDTKQAEVLDSSIAFMGLSLIIFVVLITGFGVVLGRTTGQRVIAPVIELAERIRRQDLLQHHGTPPVEDLSRGFGDDEVGLLARALDHSTHRTHAFLERERRFTRDASHELRSPVTIVRGAVELMESLPQAQEPVMARPLARIRRAADDMSNLIEAFLWLSREEALSNAGEPRDLADETDRVVERYRHLLDGKEVELLVEIDPGNTVVAPKGILGIVLGNLVANAFFYTQRGQVTIRGDGHRIEVVDSGPGIDSKHLQDVLEPHQRGESSQGFGLGLSICRDLCRRFDWHLELAAAHEDGGPSGGTRASVRFG